MKIITLLQVLAKFPKNKVSMFNYANREMILLHVLNISFQFRDTVNFKIICIIESVIGYKTKQRNDIMQLST